MLTLEYFHGPKKRLKRVTDVIVSLGFVRLLIEMMEQISKKEITLESYTPLS
jgi:hypothetical protein